MAKLRAEAGKGNAVAQFKLGVLKFPDGMDVKDEAAAAVWYRKAAEQGLAEAQNNLGFMYWMGRGVAKDSTEAVKWYRKAAEQGLAHAQNNLGWVYLKGGRDRRDLPDEFRGESATEDRRRQEALKLFLQAAKQGLAPAQMNVSWMHHAFVSEENLQAEDKAKTVEWCRKAAEQGDAAAQSTLSTWFSSGWMGLPRDREEAKKWLSKAAEKGDPDYQFKLGGLYYSYGERPINDAEAVKWYQLAAEQGHERAMATLGHCYGEGMGVALNRIEAYKWKLLADSKSDQKEAEKYASWFSSDSGEKKESEKRAREFKPKGHYYERLTRLGDAGLELEFTPRLALVYEVKASK